MKVWPDDATRGSRRPGSDAAPLAAGPMGNGNTGRPRHGDDIQAIIDAHPQNRALGGAPSVGIVGAGPVGLALGLAISRAGWPVTAVASRDEGRREKFRASIPGVRAFIDPISVVDEVELTILTIPDDAISDVVASLRLYSGQLLVHTSGLLGAEVLEPARAAGSQIGAFHPLVSFTLDTELAVAAISGATIAIEGDDRAIELLADLAEAIGGIPVRLPPGTKPAYHAAAVLASGGLVALLDAIVALGAVAGMNEAGALAVYGRLIEQTMANARALGVRAALTGPISRGDSDTLKAHVAALQRFAPDVVELYLAVARRELRLVDERGVLSPIQLERVLAALAKPA